MKSNKEQELRDLKGELEKSRYGKAEIADKEMKSNKEMSIYIKGFQEGKAAARIEVEKMVDDLDNLEFINTNGNVARVLIKKVLEQKLLKQKLKGEKK